MKTIKNLLFVAFAAMTIAACQKEFENPQGGVQNIGKIVDFTGSMDDIQTKTTIWFENGLEEGVFHTRFMNGDSVMVNGVSSGKTGKASGTVLSFSVQGVEAPYFAVSANQVAKEKDGYVKNYYDEGNHQYIITFADSQKYRLVNGKTNISFDSSADVFAAYSEDENLKFQHLSTFLVITVGDENASNPNIRNIYVRQGDGSNIAGEWYVKYDENNVPFMEPKSLTDYITYACVVKSSSEASNFSPDGVPQGKPMIIGVPSYDYENGLLVTIEDMDGNFSVFKIPAEKTKYADQGGTVFPFNPPFVPVVRETISSAEEWNSFATYVNATNGNGAKGTVTLTEDITAENLKQITNFKGIFNGNGKTITQTAATKPLFSKVSGEIKKLTLNGSLDLGSTSGAPLVNQLMTGGKISECTNNMAVTCSRSGHTYVGGLVSYMESAVIENCTNNGTLNVEVDVDGGFYNVAVAGIVADIRIPNEDEVRNVLLKNCKNTGDLTLSPALTFKAAASTDDKGMQVCGFGGIAGWVRNSATYTFTNCDNEGAVTLSAVNIQHEHGNSPRTICVGGVLGLSAPAVSGLMSPDFSKEFNLVLTDCDNTGLVYNQGVNYSSTKESKNKVFTGGLAGALMGTSTANAGVKTCTNTGTVLTHDYITGMENVIPSIRTCYCVVAGGLLGYGGYVDMDGCTVRCQIGNGKRQMVAWGGVIGYTLRPFTLKNSTVDVSGYFQRISGYKLNRAVVAVVPVNYNTAAMDVVPGVANSVISNNNIKCVLWTSSSTATTSSTDDLSASLTTNINVQENLVCGQGFTANSGITIGDDKGDNNTYVAGTAN